MATPTNAVARVARERVPAVRVRATKHSLGGLLNSPVPYTPDEVIANFDALLASFDFTPELEAMGIGRLQIFRRKRVIAELRAMFIALWRIALDKSLLDEGQLIHEAYLSSYGERYGPGQDARLLVERVRQYVDLLLQKRDKDFSEVASHLASFLSMEEPEAKALRLKLTLHIRRTYNIIFQKLL